MAEKPKDIDYEKWLSMTIDSLQNALVKNNIGIPNGELWRSIMGEVIRTGQAVEEIVIRFKQYGRFIDMRVGKGVKRPDAKAGKRKKAPFYSKTKTYQIARLRELVIINLKDKALNEVEQGFPNVVTIKL